MLLIGDLSLSLGYADFVDHVSLACTGLIIQLFRLACRQCAKVGLPQELHRRWAAQDGNASCIRRSAWC